MQVDIDSTYVQIFKNTSSFAFGRLPTVPVNHEVAVLTISYSELALRQQKANWINIVCC